MNDAQRGELYEVMSKLFAEADAHAVKLAEFLNNPNPSGKWEPHEDALVESCALIAYAAVNMGSALQMIVPGSATAVKNVLGTMTSCMAASMTRGRKLAGWVPETGPKLIVPSSEIKFN